MLQNAIYSFPGVAVAVAVAMGGRSSATFAL